jgi:hypothetical protein
VPEVLVELLSYCQNRQRIIQRSIDRQERFLLMKRFVKNIIELQQRDPVRCRDCNRRILKMKTSFVFVLDYGGA